MILKFRAWDTFDEDMVNDIFFSWQDCGYESLNECLADERWSFMQSTGLFDVNGKEIFESDIVEWEHKDTGQLVRGIIKYDTELGFWGMTDVRFNDLTAIGYLANQKVTVLGNIYKNPELVEVE
ncbi:TPA: YopX family protein [Streptococcus suis]